MTRCHSSGGYSQVLWFGPAMPAFATRMSMPPKALTVAAVAASTWDMLETSMVCVKTVPRPLSSPAVRVVSASSRSHNATLAPDASNRSVIARPNPCAAPVTTARRFLRSNWFNGESRGRAVDSFQFPVPSSQSAFFRWQYVTQLSTGNWLLETSD